MTDIKKYKVLARKYRPTKFEDLIGQDTLVQILTNSIKNNRIAYSYIFLTKILAINFIFCIFSKLILTRSTKKINTFKRWFYIGTDENLQTIYTNISTSKYSERIKVERIEKKEIDKIGNSKLIIDQEEQIEWSLIRSILKHSTIKKLTLMNSLIYTSFGFLFFLSFLIVYFQIFIYSTLGTNVSAHLEYFVWVSYSNIGTTVIIASLGLFAYFL